jgi:DNA-directed RNA polymerase subunit RPC12/RpoP
MAFLRWLADVPTHGLACPHCRLGFAEYRDVARRRQRVSVVCPRCGKKMWRTDS